MFFWFLWCQHDQIKANFPTFHTGIFLFGSVVTPYYTCQLFLRYKREIFILGVPGFLKTTQSFPKIPEKFRRSPKSSEDDQSPIQSLKTRTNASSIPVLFTSKIRDREEGIVIYSFYKQLSFLTWVWVNIFLEIVSSKMAATHIFQSGVRNWPASVSRHEIEVFNPQAWDFAGIPYSLFEIPHFC